MVKKMTGILPAQVRRVVVTGLGLITPLGVGVKTTWDNLLQSKSGIISLSHKIDPNTEYEGFDDLPSTVAGIVKKGKDGYDPEEWLERGVRMVMIDAGAVDVIDATC